MEVGRVNGGKCEYKVEVESVKWWGENKVEVERVNSGAISEYKLEGLASV